MHINHFDKLYSKHLGIGAIHEHVSDNMEIIFYLEQMTVCAYRIIQKAMKELKEDCQAKETLKVGLEKIYSGDMDYLKELEKDIK